jgi:hypothetical protein
MDLVPYVARLHRDLRVAAEPGGEEMLALAERLAAGMESSIRLVLLDALVEAAGEITRGLAPGSVEVRLRPQGLRARPRRPRPVPRHPTPARTTSTRTGAQHASAFASPSASNPRWSLPPRRRGSR